MIVVPYINLMAKSSQLFGNKEVIRRQFYDSVSMTSLMFLFLVGDISLDSSNPLKRSEKSSYFSELAHILPRGGLPNPMLLNPLPGLTYDTPFFISLSHFWLYLYLHR